MEFIQALREIVNAMPSFRDETTFQDVHEALNVEEADRANRADLQSENDALEASIGENYFGGAVPEGGKS